MADKDRVEIEVTAEGTAETAKALGQVTDALKLTQRQQEMVNATSQDLQRKARIDALKAEAKEVNSVSAAFRTLASSAQPANDQLGKSTMQFGQFRAAAGASAALIGNLGRSFVQLVPQAAGFQAAMQSGGMAMSQFLGVMGGGPGMIAAGVVGGLALLTTYFAKAKDEADKLAEETKKNAEALKEYLDALDQLKGKIADRFSQAQAGRDYEKRFLAGDLSSQEYAVERQLAKEMYAERGTLDAQVRAAAQRGDRETLVQLRMRQDRALGAPIRGEQARVFYEQARERERMQRENQAALDSMRGMEGVADADREASAGRTGRAGYGYVSSDAVQDQIKRVEQLMADSRGRVREQEAAFQSAQYQERMQQLQTEADERKRLGDKAFEDTKRREMEKRKLEERSYELMRERNRAFTDAATNVAQIGATTTVKMFSDLAKGHKVMLGTVLEGIGDQMVAEGTRVLFQAAAFAFIPGMQAAAGGLAAVGAAEIAAGMALGAAGAHSEGGSASSGAASGGKEKGGTNYADPFGNTARYGSGGGGPTVINVTMPTVLTPTAADGERIISAVNQAQRQRGARL